MTEEEKEWVELLCNVLRDDVNLKATINLYDLNGEDIPDGLLKIAEASRYSVAGILKELGMESNDNDKAWDEFFAQLLSERLPAVRVIGPNPKARNVT